MKRWKKIVLGALVILAIGIGGICVWQRNNLHALLIFATQDSQEIADTAARKRQEHQAAIEEKVPVVVRPPSTQQSDALLDRQVTADEIKEELGITGLLDREKQRQEQGQESLQAGEEKPPGQADQPEVREEELVNLCLAELYACKIDLMEVLAGLKQEAVDEWNSLPAAERTEDRKMEIGFAGLEKCYELETEVDDQVREILNRYKEQLSAIGGDTSVTGTLWGYYEEEKAAEKAYYMDKYLN